MRLVYLVETGEGLPIVFGRRSRARAYVRSMSDVYRLDPLTKGRPAEFWDNPRDLDDQVTIYTVAVQ